MSLKKQYNNSHPKCGHHSSCSCSKPKPKPCDGRCHLKVKCHCDPDCDIKAEKNLLNLEYISDGAGISEPDISATYEIVIFNRSHCKLSNLSIIDSMMGFQGNVFGSTGGFGGELRPYYTNVHVLPCSATVVPLTFEQIMENCGELVDKCNSYIPPCSVISVIVRITGRGFLLANFPTTGEQLPFADEPSITMCVQNTATIRGTITKKHDCGHCVVTAPIFPIYVKSGVKEAIKICYTLPTIEPGVIPPV
jgi:hypothetical protein